MPNPTPSTRVLLFTDTLADVNGVSRFIRDMAREARDTDRNLRIFTSTNFPCEPAPNIRAFPPRLAIKMPRYEHLELAAPPALAMLREARAFNPSAIHVSTPGPVGLIGLLAAKLLRVPLVGTYHTDFPAYVERLFDDSAGRLCDLSMRAFYQRFARVLTRSKGFAADVSRLGIPPSRITPLRPGIRLESFSPSLRDETAASLPRGLRILSVGRVSVEKNLPLLTHAWRLADAALRQRNIDAHLIIVGDGPYLQGMRTALQGTRHHFTGFRHGLALSATYAASDLFVFPSTTDTLGQAVMEAQASGLPTIVSNIGGPPEITHHNHTGLIVQSQTPQAWANAILDLATNTPRRTTMSTTAAETMRGHSIRHSFNHFWSIHEATAHPRAAV